MGAIAIVCLGAAPAGAVPTGPAWKISGIAAPTNFPPGETGTGEAGPLYLFEATNVGGAAASTPVSLQATLPAGIEPVGVTGGDDDPDSPDPSCSIALQEVTCTTPGPLGPGRSLEAAIVVDVEPGLSGPAVAEATVSGGGAAPADVAVETAITPEPPPFGFLADARGLASSLTEADGSPTTLAGSHPYQLTLDVGFPSRKAGASLLNSGHPHDVLIDLPAGLVVNPTAVPTRCTETQLNASTCPPASQLGIVTLTTAVLAGPASDSRALYNMVPPPGSASSFGFNAGDAGVTLHLLSSVRGGDYGLSAAAEELLARFPIFGMRLQLWGDPSSPSHDAARGASVPLQPRALLTMPSACGALATTARADSWEEPGAFVERGVENQDLEGNPVPVAGCGELGFSPTLEARPTTRVADSPSGLDFRLEVPQAEAPSARAAANLRRAKISLPAGLVANPSGANGLTGCAPTRIGLTSPSGSAPPRFDAAPVACPGAARIGAAEVDTPLLDHPLAGSVFLASPHDNPFGSLLALYVTAQDRGSGILVKLAGEVQADPATGRLTATFDELPQLPIAHVELKLFGGAAAPLRTPAVCGAYSTASSLTPWSAPESGPAATPSDSYPVDSAPAGSACPRDEGSLPGSLSLDVGTVSPRAGFYTPFVLDLKRDDGTQRVSSLDLALPPGLAGKLAGVRYCSEAALAAARVRAGSLEQADPSCPLASRLGGATVGAGAGPAPYYVHGGAYLAGPYRGAPLSLAIVVPAVAGPFDLGTVVVRSAIRVDPETARIRPVSDPIPAILDGIPLDVRSLRVVLDRPGFTRNPTSCDPASIGALATSPASVSTALSSRFQVAGCRSLGFRPRVSLRLLGPTRRGAHPKLRTVLSPRAGDASIRRLAVTLPGTELLDSRRIGSVCTREEFAARRCPAGALYGHARTFSPLLDRPLEGPVYLRASDTQLPGLAAALHGQVDVDISGRVDSVRGRLRTTFQALPDVPLTRVVLTLRGGRRGLLVNTGGLCARERRAAVELDAQNGKVHDPSPVVKTDCGKVGKR